MRLDFLCPGMPRSGTTTLDAILRQYPEIYLPSIKEPVYLQDYETSKKSVEWYAQKYYNIDEHNPQKEGLVYGEINPSFGFVSAKRLRDVFGEDIKIVILLRNPIKHAWSYFNFCINEGYDLMLDKGKNEKYLSIESRTKSFDVFIEENFTIDDYGKVKYIGSYNHIFMGRKYEFFCNQYLKFFPKENVKIVLFEELIREPAVVCKDVVEFLGVKFRSEVQYNIHTNDGSYRPKNAECRQKIGELNRKIQENLKSASGLEESAKIHASYIKERGKYMDFGEKVKKENLSDYSIEMLKNYFESDKKFVEDILEKNLSDVWF